MKLNCFFRIGNVERNVVAHWFTTVTPSTQNQKDFLAMVGEAISVIDYDYLISSIDPSINENGEIYFEEGESVATNLSDATWEKLAKEFAPELNSDIASLHELFLWYAYNIATGKYHLEFICDRTRQIAGPSHMLHLASVVQNSGERIGNTCKLVRHNGELVVCGDSCYYGIVFNAIGKVSYGIEKSRLNKYTSTAISIKQ